MVIIVKSYHAVVIFFIIVKTVYNDLPEGSLCEYGSSGRIGVCKLLTHCRKVRDDLIKNHELPQTCGFQETQPIVCCPRNGSEKIIPGEISKIMCRRYSRYAFGNETSNITKNGCGHTIVKKAVGDGPASEKEFPHLALLGIEEKNGSIEWVCGGTIISELYVLTSARCLSSTGIFQVKYVQIGSNEHKQELKIAETIKHPDYSYHYYYKRTDYNDIGLIKLEKPAKLNAFARPACLYTKQEILEEKAIATGWDITTEGSSMKQQLLKSTLNIFDFEECNATYINRPYYWRGCGIRKESQFCAGGVDNCQAKYGDPLQIYHIGDDIKCMYDILGVISFGINCTRSNPGAYTKVSHFIQWIENTVWPSEL